MADWRAEDSGTVQVERRRALMGAFMNRSGLRAGWRALLFLMLFALFMGACQFLTAKGMQGVRRGGEIAPGPMLLFEALQFGSMLGAAALLQWIEKRPLLPVPFRGVSRLPRFLWGALWGFVALSAIVGTLWEGHLVAFGPVRLASSAALGYALLWGAVFLLVGFSEETLLRGYLQAILARGMGFWPAALLLSVLFGAVHIGNKGESHIGIVSAALVGLLFCMSLWYTGSLWWAIGFHAAWDWGQSFFYGTADSGLLVRGHLLAEHSSGSPFWSGGATGPEGSPYVILLLLVLAALCWAWWRRKPAEWPLAQSTTTSASPQPPGIWTEPAQEAR
jgi:membrane protease YdiL (CAAX protease family)